MGAIPLTELTVTNQVVNYAEKMNYRDTLNLNSYGSNLSEKKLSVFTKKSDIITNQTNKKIQNEVKNGTASDAVVTGIIEESSLNLTDYKIEVCDSYQASLFTYAYNMSIEFSASVSAYCDNLISQMSSPTGGVIANIKAAAVNAINTLISSLIATASAIWENFQLNIVNLLNSKLAIIAGFFTAYKNLVVSTITAVSKGIEVANNFYKRVKGLSSTSPYIQANVPDVKGNLKANAKALADTPDVKIITPNLKSDVNKVKSFASNPLAVLLGFVSSLIPSVSSKAIAEPKPTSDKAEYGKIQMFQDKAGFTTIKDQTPGNEREINLHPSGSYTAKIPNKENPKLGDTNTKCTGDKQDITDGNWNITTSKDKVEIVVGENKIEIRKNDSQNVNGNRDVNIDGTFNTVVGQDVSDDFKSNYSGKIDGNYTETVGGNRTEKTGGNLTETVGGNHKETITGGLTIHVTGAVNIHSGGITNISSKAACNITAGGIVKITGSKVLIG